MDYLVKTYKTRFKEEFSKYGFKTYRRCFYRVINDVFQSFELQKSVSGRDCRINFWVYPLCSDHNITKTFCGTEHLKLFKRDNSWFEYDRNDESSMEKCIEDMIVYMHKYLIPFFERSNNCENAYDEICKYELMLGRNNSSLYAYDKFRMSLKIGKYNQAVDHLKEVLAQSKDAYNINLKSREKYGEQLDPKYVERMKKEWDILERQIELVSKQDMDYINEYISSNESRNLKNLGML